MRGNADVQMKLVCTAKQHSRLGRKQAVEVQHTTSFRPVIDSLERVGEIRILYFDPISASRNLTKQHTYL